MSLISAVRVSSKAPSSSLIFIHGLGDSGDGWSWFPNIVKHFNIIPSSVSDNINYVFPNAPAIPVSLNGGYRMPAWFDIYELNNPNARQDADGFLKSVEVANSFIKEQIEKYNVPAEKIIIGGFSQGAAVALATISMLEYKIGGAVILSGFCPIRDEIKKLHKSANYDTPIFQGHGTVDEVINFQYGKQTSEFYQSLGFKNLKFHGYPGVGHSTNDDELKQVQEFIKDVLEK